MLVKVVLRSDTADKLGKQNPLLARGEPAFEYDKGRFRIGDGVRRYNDLPVQSFDPGVIAELTNAAVAAAAQAQAAAAAAAASSGGASAASETAMGVVQIATEAQVTEGTDTTRVVTPATLAAVLSAITVGEVGPATPDAAGVVRLATSAEVTEGTSTTTAVTPASIAARFAVTNPPASTTSPGIVRFATPAEVVTGTATDRVATPAGVAAAISAQPVATTTAKGPVLLAAPAEGVAATDTGKAMTPAATRAAIDARVPQTAAETTSGLVRFASAAEVAAGLAADRAVTPAGVSAAIAARLTAGGAVNLTDLADVATLVKDPGSLLQWDPDAEQWRSGPIDYTNYPPDTRYTLRSDLPADLRWVRAIHVQTTPTDVAPPEFPTGGITIDVSRPARGITETVNIIPAAVGTITLPPVTTAQVHDITLAAGTATVTINPPPAVGGQEFRVSLRNPASGTVPPVAWGTGFRFSDATNYLAPALPTGASEVADLDFASTRGASWGHRPPMVRYAASGVVGATPAYTTSAVVTTGAVQSATQVSVVLPATINAGQIVHVAAFSSGTTAVLTAPAGWTLLSGRDGTTAISGYLWRRVMDGTEDGTTLTITSSVGARLSACYVMTTGGSTTGEVVAVEVDTTVEAPPTVTVPPITPTVANSLLINLVGIRWSGLAEGTSPIPDITPASEWIERAETYEGRPMTATGNGVTQFGVYAQTRALSGEANVAQSAASASANNNVTEVSYVIAVPPPVTT